MQQSVVHAVAGTVGKGGNCGVGKKTGLRGDKPGEGYTGPCTEGLCTWNESEHFNLVPAPAPDSARQSVICGDSCSRLVTHLCDAEREGKGEHEGCRGEQRDVQRVREREKRRAIYLKCQTWPMRSQLTRYD